MQWKKSIKKTQAVFFKGIVCIAVILTMALLSGLLSVNGTASAQYNPTPSPSSVVITETPDIETDVSPGVSLTPAPSDSLQVASASILKTIQDVGTSPNAIALNPKTHKAYVINSGRSRVSVLDISADKFERKMDAGRKFYWGIAIKPGSKSLYVSDNAAGEIPEILEENLSIIEKITLGPVLPEGLAINPELNKAYVAHSGNLMSVVDLSTNEVIKAIDTGHWNHLIAVNEETDRIYITRSDPSRVTIINGNTDERLPDIVVGDGPWGVAVNSKTNLIYVANSGSNTVSVIDGAANKVIKSIPVQNHPWGIAVNEEANRIYVANSSSNSVSIIDGVTNQVVETVFNVGNRPAGVAANPKTGKVYVTNERDNSVTVILDDAAVPGPSDLTPIILVPGYYASFNAHRMYPTPNDFPDEWEWWPIIPETCLGDIDRARCTYQPLIDALEDAGYDSDPNSPNQNLFIAFYNWLRPNAESAIMDLEPVIAEALAKTSATNVHISLTLSHWTSVLFSSCHN